MLPRQRLPDNPGYGGCSCDCHFVANMKHFRACCRGEVACEHRNVEKLSWCNGPLHDVWVCQKCGLEFIPSAMERKYNPRRNPLHIPL